MRKLIFCILCILIIGCNGGTKKQDNPNTSNKPKQDHTEYTF